MGLPVRLVLHAADEAAARGAASAAFARIAALDRMLSDYRDDSELRALERRPGELVDVSPELFTVLAAAVGIAEASGGAFNPAVGPLVALWREARRSGRHPDPAAIEAARGRSRWERIHLDRRRRAVRLSDRGMRLDLGGIAKGYILQEARRALRARGVTRALLEAGGDIVTGDPPPGRSGWSIEVPDAGKDFRRRASRLANAALATSGPSAQYIESAGVRYSHVIDPRTGLGTTSRRQAHVIADDATVADGLATALTLLDGREAEALLHRFPRALVCVTSPAPPSVPHEQPD